MAAMKPIRRTLDNGLSVLLLEDHSAPVVSFWIWYKVGGRSERPGLTGISHWVEHMMFKGTPKMGSGMLDKLFARRGASWNGFTSNDYTAYLETLPLAAWELAPEIESDRMANTVFQDEDVASERTVILSERGIHENDPGSRLYEEVTALAYKNHPYRLPVIGWREDLERITRDELHAHYRAFYRPNNALVVVVGAVGEDAAMGTLRRHFDPLEPGEIPHPPLADEPPQDGERRVTMRRPGGAVPLVQMAYHVVDARHDDLVPLLVLDAVLSGGKPIGWGDRGGMGKSSRLYRALVRGRLAASAQTSVFPSIDPGLFWFTASAQPGTSAETLEVALDHEIARIQNDDAAADELHRAKKQLRAQLAYAGDGAAGRALWLGILEMTGVPAWDETLADRIADVSAADVRRVAQAYLRSANRTVGWYVPAEAPGGSPDGRRTGAAETGGGATPPSPRFEARRRHFYRGAPAGGAADVPIRPDTVVRRELGNGAVVVAMRDRSTPAVSFRALLPDASASADLSAGPGGAPAPGTARFVANMLTRGAASLTAEQLAETLDGLGASLGAGASRDAAEIGGKSLVEDFDQLLGLAHGVVCEPSFPPEEIERLRGELTAGLRMAAKDTRRVAEWTLSRLAYPAHHPFSLPVEGREETVAALSREDLLTLWRRRYRPNGAIFTVVGDVDPNAAADAVAQRFGAWPAGGEPLPDPGNPAPLTERRSEVVAIAGKVQADIALGLPALRRSHPDFHAMLLGNLILGQLGLMGRIGDNVREKKGLAYYATSGLTASRWGGLWYAISGVAPQNVKAAHEAMVEEFVRMRDEGPEEDEVRDAIDNRIGWLQVALSGLGGKVALLSGLEYHGLELDYYQRMPDLVRAVTRDAIIEAFRRWFPGPYAIAVAGPEGIAIDGADPAARG
jgi:zinc protease